MLLVWRLTWFLLLSFLSCMTLIQNPTNYQDICSHPNMLLQWTFKSHSPVIFLFQKSDSECTAFYRAQRTAPFIQTHSSLVFNTATATVAHSSLPCNAFFCNHRHRRCACKRPAGARRRRWEDEHAEPRPWEIVLLRAMPASRAQERVTASLGL